MSGGAGNAIKGNATLWSSSSKMEITRCFTSLVVLDLEWALHLGPADVRPDRRPDLPRRVARP
jgi:hypothetical protein